MRRKLLQAMTAGLVLATATGCTWEDFPRLGMPTPTTEEAPRILSLWQGSWAAALATGVLVWGLILWSAFFHRRSRTKVEVPPQTRYNMPIEALYTAVPLVIVSVLFYFVARDEARLTQVSAKPQHVVNVVGFQWSWAFNYENTEIPDPASTTAAYDIGTPKEALIRIGASGRYFYVSGVLLNLLVLTALDGRFRRLGHSRRWLACLLLGFSLLVNATHFRSRLLAPPDRPAPPGLAPGPARTALRTPLLLQPLPRILVFSSSSPPRFENPAARFHLVCRTPTHRALIRSSARQPRRWRTARTQNVRMCATMSRISSSLRRFSQAGMVAILPMYAPPFLMIRIRYSSGSWDMYSLLASVPMCGLNPPRCPSPPSPR